MTANSTHPLPANPVDCFAPFSTDAWANAWSLWQAAAQAEAEYDRCVWRPAVEADSENGAGIPSDVNAHMERLMLAHEAADEAIIATPAPDLSKAVWKLDHARQRWADYPEIPDRWWDAIMADLHRFGGGQPNVEQVQAAYKWHNAKSTWAEALAVFEQASEDEECSYNEAVKAETAAWREMLNTPAPNRPALLEKLEQLLRIEPAIDATNAWDGDDVRQTLADCRRLLVEG